MAIPRISEAEWEIMEVLWERAPLRAAEVAEALEGVRDWSPTTVRTMLARLSRKGALCHEAEGRGFLYSPAVSREDCRAAESRSFVDRVFGGHTSPMLAWFVEEEDLSDEDLAELQKLIRARRSER